MRFSRAVLTGVLALSAIVWAAPQSKPTGQADTAGQTSKKASKKTAPASPVDLNTASDKELEAIPGIGRATAKKIVDHRPYQSVDDLAKAGVGAKQIDQIRPMVTVNGAPTGGAPAAAQRAPKGEQSGSSNRAATPSAAPNPPPSGSGMVWVNTETKVYHREGDRWYGKTKHGTYMSEADAVKAGYRAAKNK